MCMRRATVAVLTCTLTSLVVLLECYQLGGRFGLITGFIAIALASAAMYWYADRIMLRFYAARGASSAETAELRGLVSELAESASLPEPKVYISADSSPRAFVTGRNIAVASLVVTEGLLKSTSLTQLRQVIAHELEDMRQRDGRISVIAGSIALGFLHVASFALRRSAGRRRWKSNLSLRCESVGCTGLPE